MAINLQTLRTRSLTALVFVAVMLAGLFINGFSFIILFTIVLIGCLYEYGKLIKKINPQRYLNYLPLSFIYIVVPLLMLIDLGINSPVQLQEQFATTTFPGYSPLMPCAIIFSIWINDTMAYIVGSMIGKTPFSPISPKKTWEGTAGGALLCIIVIGLLGSLLKITSFLPWYHWVIIALICAVFGTLGDLLESKLKRMANIKDSGNIMPGHGGFLDRFDSLLVATPFVWIYIKLIF